MVLLQNGMYSYCLFLMTSSCTSHQILSHMRRSTVCGCSHISTCSAIHHLLLDQTESACCKIRTCILVHQCLGLVCVQDCHLNGSQCTSTKMVSSNIHQLLKTSFSNHSISYGQSQKSSCKDHRLD